MKVTSAILLFCCLGLALAQFPTCTERTCAKAEEVCGWISNLTFTNCRSDSYCTYTNTAVYSEEGTGICRVPLRLGDTCDSSTVSGVCESGTYCYQGVCAVSSPFGSSDDGFLYPGESCDYNMECQYNSPYSGDAGTRDSENLCDGKCKSIKRGDYCNDDNQCNYNKDYCGRKNMCEKYIKDGDACFFNDATSQRRGCGKIDRTCVPNGLSGNAGTCRKKHSQSKGAYCSDTDDCKEGLLCNIYDSNAYGVCLEPYKTATLNKACPSPNITINNGCNSTNFETCQCTKDGDSKCIVPELRPKGYHNAVYDLEECMRKHNCDWSVSDGFACMKENCKGKTCKMYKTLQKHESGAFAIPGTNLFSNTCVFEGLCNSAFTLAASPVLALLAMIVVFAL